jgi:hypothetical protein
MKELYYVYSIMMSLYNRGVIPLPNKLSSVATTYFSPNKMILAIRGLMHDADMES